MIGNAIYGSGVSFALMGPKYWWVGMYIGGFLGWKILNSKGLHGIVLPMETTFLTEIP